MRTTVTLDDHVLEQAAQLTDVQERAVLLREALTALVERESARGWLFWAERNRKSRRRPGAGLQMILPDTSIWIDHLRHGDADLATRLSGGGIACHPLVVAEIALASLKGGTRP